MNTILTYLSENWQRLKLEKYGTPAKLSSVILTPGFQASSHLIVFVLNKGQQAPFLVVKLPRISGDHHRLDLEAESLRRLHASKSGGYDSVPRVVAYEDWKDYRLLVETMVQGQIMRPPLIRKQTETCIQAAFNWLQEINQNTAVCAYKIENWFEKLAINSFAALENSFPLLPEEQQLIDQTRQLIEPLRLAKIPLVFEHGDFSSPNLMLANNTDLGVVDWELAEQHGLPTADFIFFLTYIAFCKENATKQPQQVKAFQNAFFNHENPGWAMPHLRKYCKKLEIPEELLKPLFVLAWTRYVANMISRLKGETGSSSMLSAETTAWLRKNRFYLLWQYTVKQFDKIA